MRLSAHHKLAIKLVNNKEMNILNPNFRTLENYYLDEYNLIAPIYSKEAAIFIVNIDILMKHFQYDDKIKRFRLET